MKSKRLNYLDSYDNQHAYVGFDSGPPAGDTSEGPGGGRSKPRGGRRGKGGRGSRWEGAGEGGDCRDPALQAQNGQEGGGLDGAGGELPGVDHGHFFGIVSAGGGKPRDPPPQPSGPPKSLFDLMVDDPQSAPGPFGMGGGGPPPHQQQQQDSMDFDYPGPDGTGGPRGPPRSGDFGPGGPQQQNQWGEPVPEPTPLFGRPSTMEQQGQRPPPNKWGQPQGPLIPDAEVGMGGGDMEQRGESFKKPTEVEAPPKPTPKLLTGEQIAKKAELCLPYYNPPDLSSCRLLKELGIFILDEFINTDRGIGHLELLERFRELFPIFDFTKEEYPELNLVVITADFCGFKVKGGGPRVEAAVFDTVRVVLTFGLVERAWEQQQGIMEASGVDKVNPFIPRLHWDKRSCPEAIRGEASVLRATGKTEPGWNKGWVPSNLPAPQPEKPFAMTVEKEKSPPETPKEDFVPSKDLPAFISVRPAGAVTSVFKKQTDGCGPADDGSKAEKLTPQPPVAPIGTPLVAMPDPESEYRSPDPERIAKRKSLRNFYDLLKEFEELVESDLGSDPRRRLTPGVRSKLYGDFHSRHPQAFRSVAVQRAKLWYKKLVFLDVVLQGQGGNAEGADISAYEEFSRFVKKFYPLAEAKMGIKPKEVPKSTSPAKPADPKDSSKNVTASSGKATVKNSAGADAASDWRKEASSKPGMTPLFNTSAKGSLAGSKAPLLSAEPASPEKEKGPGPSPLFAVLPGREGGKPPPSLGENNLAAARREAGGFLMGDGKSSVAAEELKLTQKDPTGGGNTAGGSRRFVIFSNTLREPNSQFHPFALAYPEPLMWQGQKFHTAEHAYLWTIAMHYQDPATAKSIQAIRDIVTAREKITAKAAEGFDMMVWNREMGWKAMEGIVEAKFTQNPALATELLGTGDAVLVECTPGELYWGCGLDPRPPGAVERITTQTEGPWPGENRYGRTVMEFRTRAEEMSRSSKY